MLATAMLFAQEPSLDTMELVSKFETMPRVTSPLTQTYPAALRQAGVTGRALLQVVVGPTGAVEPAAVVLLSADDPWLASFAIALTRQLVWQPGRNQGKPVTGVVTIPVDFHPKAGVVTFGAPGVVADVVLPAHWSDSPLQVIARPDARFHDSLRGAGAVGSASEVEFIIGRDGAVEPASIVVHEPAPPTFALVLVAIVSRMRFSPLQVGRRPSRVVERERIALGPEE